MSDLAQIRAELGAALSQSLPDVDDQHIMEHVRRAYLLAGGDEALVLRSTQTARTPDNG